MGMTKTEFTRKLMGDKQHRKNKLIQEGRNQGREADDFTYGNTHHIQAKKQLMKGK